MAKYTFNANILIRQLLVDKLLSKSPLSQELRNQFVLNALGNLTALEKVPSFGAFDAIAGMINLLALVTSKRADLNMYFVILQSSALAMEGIRKRSEKSGNIYVSGLELSTITNAVIRFEEILPLVTRGELANAKKELKSNPQGKGQHDTGRNKEDDATIN